MKFEAQVRDGVFFARFERDGLKGDPEAVHHFADNMSNWNSEHEFASLAKVALGLALRPNAPGGMLKVRETHEAEHPPHVINDAILRAQGPTSFTQPPEGGMGGSPRMDREDSFLQAHAAAAAANASLGADVMEARADAAKGRRLALAALVERFDEEKQMALGRWAREHKK
jgi:hypothetical protein